MKDEVICEVIGNQKAEEKKYWCDTFSAVSTRSNFPYSCSGSTQEYGIGTKVYQIEGYIYNRIIQISNHSDFNLFLILFSLVNELLHVYSSQDELLTGTTILKAKDSGNFINNVVPIHCKITADSNFKQVLGQMKRTVTEAMKHANYPIEWLMRKLGITDENEDAGLFGVTVQLENLQEILSMNDNCQDILFTFRRNEDSIQATFEYNKKFYEESVVEGLAKHFFILAEKVLKETDLPIRKIDLLSEEEKEKIRSFNQTSYAYECVSNFVDLFERKAEEAPKSIAVVYGTHRITYGELSEKSSYLADCLIQKGVTKESIIAVSTEPSVKLLVFVLAIWKAGAAYLPIGFHLPKERTDFMLADSNVKLFLAEHVTCERIPKGVEWMEEPKGSSTTESTQWKNIVKSPADLAYIIYTSGTTGVPKGVMIEQGNLLNYSNWFIRKMELQKKDKSVLTSSFGFDLGYSSVFPALAGGLEIHLTDKELYSQPEELIHYIVENKITYLKMTPSLFGTIVNYVHLVQSGFGEHVRLILLGGESLNFQDVKKFSTMFPNVKLVNHYGPTEATIGCITYSIDSENMEQLEQNNIIGTPIDNVKIAILDGRNMQTPIGVPGQICVQGAGLARGYRNHPELTEEKFHKKRGENEEEERIYHTGDLGKYLEDGSIVFLKRKDNQVKIRGFRVELEEIQRKLLNNHMVREAAVIARSDKSGSQYLCACITSDMTVDVTELRTYLQTELPDYMVPSHIMIIDKMPMTLNGKLDRKALPEPSASESSTEYEPPRNEVEEKMCRIWEKHLEVGRIGIRDNFFESGGHSINIIGVVLELQQNNIILKTGDIYKYQTIKSLYENLLASKVQNNLINDASILCQVLQKEFSAESKMVECLVNKETIKVLLVRNLEGNLLKNIRTYLMEHVENSIQPNSIKPWEDIFDTTLDQKSYTASEFAHALGLKEGSFEQLTSNLEQVKEMERNMKKSMSQTRVIHTYPLSPAQELRLEHNEITGSILFFDYYIEIALMEQAIKNLIASQPFLKCKLILKEGEYVWEEHEYLENIRIPFIDLSMYDCSLDGDLQKKIIKDYFDNWKMGEDDFFYRIQIMKLDERKTIVLMPFRHIIYDRVSRDYIEREILNNYELLKNDENVRLEQKDELLSDYMKQVTKGVVGISQQQLFDKFELHEIIRQQKKLNDKLAQKDISSHTKVEWKYKKNTSENTWEFAFALFHGLCKEIFDVDKIPLYVIQNGRKLEDKDYMGLIGEFTNYVPVLLNNEDTQNGEQRKKIQYIIEQAADSNIIFQQLLKNCSELREVLGDPMKNMILLFNFQGVYSHEGINQFENLVFENSEQVEHQSVGNLLSFTARTEQMEILLTVDFPFVLDTEAVKQLFEKEAARIGAR